MRRIIQIEIAVSRAPSAPDFSGLDLLMESPIADTGKATTKAVTTWLTERLKEQAGIQKQARLYREEMSKSSTDKGESTATGSDPNGGNPSARRRRAKAKASSGGIASTASST